MSHRHLTDPSPAIIDSDAAAALLEPLTALVAEAGEAILAIRNDALAVSRKTDGSPVTEADLAADRIIADGLARLAPGVRTLSEERAGAAAPPFPGAFFVIDPLDGTKEFIAGRDEFTVNLALVIDGAPVVGVVGAPALGLV
ncbi:MAG: inositol monophosphatase family protein, partial [Xanthobacteraceae bacterium]